MNTTLAKSEISMKLNSGGFITKTFVPTVYINRLYSKTFFGQKCYGYYSETVDNDETSVTAYLSKLSNYSIVIDDNGNGHFFKDINKDSISIKLSPITPQIVESEREYSGD